VPSNSDTLPEETMNYLEIDPETFDVDLWVASLYNKFYKRAELYNPKEEEYWKENEVLYYLRNSFFDTFRTNNLTALYYQLYYLWVNALEEKELRVIAVLLKLGE
jgi:hypothetical protein